MRDILKKAVTSFIGRVILALYTLIVVPVLPTLINFVNDTLGYNLTDAQVQEYSRNAAYGIAALATVWLLNNGLFERAALKAKEILDLGREESNR
jgi:fumarate reductase subunit D